MARNILIVEDDSAWRSEIETICREALADLVPPLDAAIKTASQLSHALEVIQSEPAAFSLITLDLNLNDTVSNDDGMKLLEYITENAPQTNTAIVTGQSNIQYAIEGLHIHRTLCFIEKNQFDAEEFKKMVQASVLYADAVFLLKTWGWQNTQAAEKIWETIQTIDFTRPAYRPSYRLNLKDELQKRLDTITRIPNSDWSDKALQNLIHRQDWALIVLKINNLEWYSSVKNGSGHPDQITRFLARILKTTVAELGNAEDYIGHLGGYQFLVISTPEKIRSIAHTVKSRFETDIEPFYDYRDWERGSMNIYVNGKETEVDLMSLSIGLVHAGERDFQGILDIKELGNARQTQTLKPI